MHAEAVAGAKSWSQIAQKSKPQPVAPAPYAQAPQTETHRDAPGQSNAARRARADAVWSGEAEDEDDMSREWQGTFNPGVNPPTALPKPLVNGHRVQHSHAGQETSVTGIIQTSSFTREMSTLMLKISFKLPACKSTSCLN